MNNLIFLNFLLYLFVYIKILIIINNIFENYVVEHSLYNSCKKVICLAIVNLGSTLDLENARGLCLVSKRADNKLVVS